MRTLIIQGFERDLLSVDDKPLTKDDNLQLKNAYQFSSTRGDSAKHKLVLGDTDLLELVFEDDTVWVGGADIVHDIFPNAAKQSRAVGDEFEIPMYLETDENTRGVIGNIALKFLHVFAKKAVVGKVIEIASGLEKKLLQNASGLYWVNDKFELNKATVKNTDKPFLLFIH
jgi:hypothetical protein